jgi:hypothetical protein
VVVSEFDLHVTMSNLSQLDRHQNEAHKTPIVHQEQNAQRTEEELQQRTTMPVAPDEIEKKNINPDDRRSSRRDKKRDRRFPRRRRGPRRLNESGSSDHFVDVRA